LGVLGGGGGGRGLTSVVSARSAGGRGAPGIGDAPCHLPPFRRAYRGLRGGWVGLRLCGRGRSRRGCGGRGLVRALVGRRGVVWLRRVLGSVRPCVEVDGAVKHRGIVIVRVGLWVGMGVRQVAR
jgi:hypothetical protein